MSADTAVGGRAPMEQQDKVIAAATDMLAWCEQEGESLSMAARHCRFSSGDLKCLLSALRTAQEDGRRLNWLEQMRADVFTVTADEWEEGEVPRLLRYSVQCENWKRGEQPAFDGPEGTGPTLRDAIDKAMLGVPV